MKPTGSTVMMVLLLILAPVGLAGCSGSSSDSDRSSPSVDPRPARSQDPEHGGGPISFERFPLDLGWEETYGPNAVNGPDSGAGGISMPEGHCHEEVLFESGYEDKLSTYVANLKSSHTRQVLRYANAPAARTAFRSMIQAVASCPISYDAYSARPAYSAEVYAAIDEENARNGTRTFTFAYTSIGSTPFGVLYQFAVIDDLLYGSDKYGRWTTKSADAGVAALDRDNSSLIPLLSRVAR